MAADGVSDHFAQFLKCFALRGNGVSYCGGHISTVAFVFVNFKNDFAHDGMLFCSFISAGLGVL
jgi:hypothetical protein